MSVLDILIVFLYFISCLGIGLYNFKKTKTIKQYAFGFKGVKAPLLVCTIFATAIGAGSTIGAIEKIYFIGAAYVLKQFVQPLYWLITAKIFAMNIEQFSGCLTISGVMHKLYGKPGRWLTTFASVCIGVGVIAAQAIAAGAIFHYFFGISKVSGIIISYGILTLYSALGGMRSVVTTEIFQFMIFFFIFPVSYVLMLSNVGGFDQLMQMLPASHAELSLQNLDIWFYGSLILYSLLPECDSTMIQRFLMADNSQELKQSLNITALISIPFTISLCLVAYIIKATAPNLKGIEPLFYYTANLPMGVKGCMITGLLAIVMSTAESWLNSTAVIMVNDVAKVLFPKLKVSMQMHLLRGFSVLISLLSIFIALSGKNILEIVWLFDSIWFPIILIPICVGFMGFKTNSRTFVVSSVVALIAVGIGAIFAGEVATISLCFGLFGNAIGFFGMHNYQIKMGYIEAKEKQYKPKSKFSFGNFFTKTQENWLSFAKNMHRGLAEMHSMLYILAGFTMIYHFIFMLNIVELPARNALIALIMLGSFMNALLLLKDVLFSKGILQKYMPIYSGFCITLCLPFLATYIMLLSGCETLWVVSFLFSLIVVYFFLNALISIAVNALGIAAGFLFFLLTQKTIGITIPMHFDVSNCYIYLFFLLAALKLLMHKEKSQDDKISMMQTMGGAIAHEVRTPMATINMCSETMNMVLNTSFKDAKKVGKNYAFFMPSEDYEALGDFNDTIKKVSTKSNYIIDNILLTLKTSVIANDKKTINVNNFIKDAIAEYATYHPETLNVKLKLTKKLKTYASPHYLKHLIFNLLKNSYRYAGSNAEICIEIKNNSIYFTDYGVGIAEDDLPYIFDRFYSKGESGAGLGLAFCKMVMDDLEGSISCRSKVGSFTQFKLKFSKS